MIAKTACGAATRSAMARTTRRDIQWKDRQQVIKLGTRPDAVGVKVCASPVKAFTVQAPRTGSSAVRAVWSMRWFTSTRSM
ncbi:hypothetical protein AB0F03_33535 [Streptomyces sp. NPDC028722]|uniref:hypothetical protein n=1 Tax=Streptomyces sp. NPDC028722 TaxID=3155016 RepID=UPI0033D80594